MANLLATMNPLRNTLSKQISRSSIARVRKFHAPSPRLLPKGHSNQFNPDNMSNNSTPDRAAFSTTSQPQAQVEDSENFWKVAADDSVFWDAYVSTRPKYSNTFYNEIYNHHAAHSNSWKTAHDVGCGAGQVTAELAEHFQHVVASDINDTHVTVSKQRLQGLPAEQVSYSYCKGEDLHRHHAPGSVDVITVAEAMVLMDEQEALDSFAHLLRSGGTLASWFYGQPTFSDPVLRALGQPIIDEIMVYSWSRVIQGSGTKRLAGFKRAADGMASWLDFVAFDPKTWTDVHRIKWNPTATLPFFGEKACGFPIDIKNRVAPGERCEVREDASWWQNDWDISSLKKYFRVLFPGFRKALSKSDPEIDRMFAQLTEVMGGEQAVCHFTWPAVLILATKK